jgi:hypothetical protein
VAPPLLPLLLPLLLLLLLPLLLLPLLLLPLRRTVPRGTCDVRNSKFKIQNRDSRVLIWDSPVRCRFTG